MAFSNVQWDFEPEFRSPFSVAPQAQQAAQSLYAFLHFTETETRPLFSKTACIHRAMPAEMTSRAIMGDHAPSGWTRLKSSGMHTGPHFPRQMGQLRWPLVLVDVAYGARGKMAATTTEEGASG